MFLPQFRRFCSCCCLFVGLFVQAKLDYDIATVRSLQKFQHSGHVTFDLACVASVSVAFSSVSPRGNCDESKTETLAWQAMFDFTVPKALFILLVNVLLNLAIPLS